jgi:hypothetical protein
MPNSKIYELYVCTVIYSRYEPAVSTFDYMLGSSLADSLADSLKTPTAPANMGRKGIVSTKRDFLLYSAAKNFVNQMKLK